MAPSHMATGWIGGVAAARLLDASTTASLFWGAVCAITVIYPDWDHPNSTFTKALPPITPIGSKMIRALSRAVYLMTRTEKDRKVAGRHRMLTHGWFWATLSGAAVEGVTIWRHWDLAMGGWFALATFWGCLLHCLGDDVTESGEPFWFPFKIKGQRWHVVHLLPKKMRLRTGKKPEKWIYRLVFIPGCFLVIPGVAGAVFGVIVQTAEAMISGYHQYRQARGR